MTWAKKPDLRRKLLLTLLPDPRGKVLGFAGPLIVSEKHYLSGSVPVTGVR